jgi:uncharacterized protein
MVRPRKCRRTSVCPVARFYKPQGIPVRQLSIVSLKEEELEALFLADIKDMEHESAAVLMNVSRSTFSRILAEARKVVATALVEGAALKIEGGHFSHETQEMKGTENADNG